MFWLMIGLLTGFYICVILAFLGLYYVIKDDIEDHRLD